MHVPDGFLDIPTSIATAAVSATVVTVALRRARQELTEAAAPLAGLVAAFIFSVQMLNFPVGVGTSGHLLGGALAAVLVGPWVAIICLTVVFAVQGLLFADGGLSALGTNVLLMGIVTVTVGYGVSRVVMAALPKRPASSVPAAALGALVSVPVAAMAFVGLYALGGTTELPVNRLFTYMVGWHAVIGIGEAVITGLTVAAVVATRPDLVHLARGMRRTLTLTRPDGTTTEVTPQDAALAPGRRLGGRVIGVAVGVTVVLAGVVSSFASSHPDGLNYVAGQLGFGDVANASAVQGGPLSGYAVRGIANPYVATGLAGLAGVAVVVLIGIVIARLLARRDDDRTRQAANA